MRAMQPRDTAKNIPQKKKTNPPRKSSSLKGHEIISRGIHLPTLEYMPNCGRTAATLSGVRGVGKQMFMFPLHRDCTDGIRAQALQAASRVTSASPRLLAATISSNHPRWPSPHDCFHSNCPTRVVPAQCDLGHPQPMPTEASHFIKVA